VSLQIAILRGTFLTLAAQNAALSASFFGYLREKLKIKKYIDGLIAAEGRC